ncbi:MAG: prephenate dehydrogenase/arogenate dehydrogenase family protein [Pseudomonadales bacterium]|jgi:3-phosphoshikimate 1-carboxyvinyltransferase|nr:prephenate dehydrogenase/arogenate dehydrogenase family protein [Pseudomonadales bacterium]MDP7595426.1 prephenate dehydrogenase/arogenate dehydrogenase family protein [Pseudomonadales bacterium]HJN49659.1 prephenate dehydrogenase/arogenate dehydrogenase family protein [Pseudomonadales bacterium]|tara:strand:+ start:41 stop:946 length:906 start_codon:yes stop_codon:yes gene_type:complete
MINRLAVLGVGLIGGSFALALRKRGLCREFIGYDLSADSIAKALECGVLDEGAATVEEAVRSADLILLSVPIMAMQQMLAEIEQALWREGEPVRDNLVITDVGSVKSNLLSAAKKVFGRIPACLVPGHPIAGSEKNGVASSRGDLFDHHKVILTPADQTSAQAQQLITQLWQGIGAEVLTMQAAHHDQVLAGTSHLPHLLAYALVDTLSAQGDSMEIFRYAAGGFRDFTRIAASDPVMWRDIFAANGGEVIEYLDRYLQDLSALRDAMESGDTDYLMDVFQRAKTAREHFSSIDGNKGPED